MGSTRRTQVLTETPSPATMHTQHTQHTVDIAFQCHCTSWRILLQPRMFSGQQQTIKNNKHVNNNNKHNNVQYIPRSVTINTKVPCYTWHVWRLMPIWYRFWCVQLFIPCGLLTFVRVNNATTSVCSSCLLSTGSPETENREKWSRIDQSKSRLSSRIL